MRGLHGEISLFMWSLSRFSKRVSYNPELLTLGVRSPTPTPLGCGCLMISRQSQVDLKFLESK